MGNVKLFLPQKSQFDLVEKITNKKEKRTRASLFQSSEDGKEEKTLCGLISKYEFPKLAPHSIHFKYFPPPAFNALS